MGRAESLEGSTLEADTTTYSPKPAQDVKERARLLEKCAMSAGSKGLSQVWRNSISRSDLEPLAILSLDIPIWAIRECKEPLVMWFLNWWKFQMKFSLGLVTISR